MALSYKDEAYYLLTQDGESIDSAVHRIVRGCIAAGIQVNKRDVEEDVREVSYSLDTYPEMHAYSED